MRKIDERDFLLAPRFSVTFLGLVGGLSRRPGPRDKRLKSTLVCSPVPDPLAVATLRGAAARPRPGPGPAPPFIYLSINLSLGIAAASALGGRKGTPRRRAYRVD